MAEWPPVIYSENVKALDQVYARQRIAGFLRQAAKSRAKREAAAKDAVKAGVSADFGVALSRASKETLERARVARNLDPRGCLHEKWRLGNFDGVECCRCLLTLNAEQISALQRPFTKEIKNG